MLRSSLLISGLIIGATATVAPAAVLVSQNFDDTAVYTPSTTGTVGSASTTAGAWGPFNPTSNASPAYLHGPRVIDSLASSGTQSAQLVRDTFETSNLYADFSSLDDATQYELSYSLYQPLTGTAGVVVRLGNASVASQNQLGILLQNNRQLHTFNGAWISRTSALTNSSNNDWVHIRHVIDATDPAAATMAIYYAVGAGVEQLVGTYNVGAIIPDIHRLQFNAQGTNMQSQSVYIDNVRLTAVPEPASLSLLATGGMLLARRSRRSR